jgi:hypothetical protein
VQAELAKHNVKCHQYDALPAIAVKKEMLLSRPIPVCHLLPDPLPFRPPPPPGGAAEACCLALHPPCLSLPPSQHQPLPCTHLILLALKLPTILLSRLPLGGRRVA